MARVVVQRVSHASVRVGQTTVASIEKGLAILIGIRQGDDEVAVDRLADKVGSLRIFADVDGKMNLSADEASGSMLVISQFTLYGDVRKGRRPSFVTAADPETGRRLYERFADRLASQGHRVECGEFGAYMLVSIENDGPVTLVLDSAQL